MIRRDLQRDFVLKGLVRFLLVYFQQTNKKDKIEDFRKT